MKKFRIVYWFNSCITECYVSADSKATALDEFRRRKGDKRIVNVEVIV